MLVGHLARLQRLQVQANGRDGGLEFVRDGVEERVLLVVAMQFAHEEHGVDDDAGDDQREREHAEHQRQQAPPVDVDPADVQGDRRRDEDDAEGHEDDRRGVAARHMGILAGLGIRDSGVGASDPGRVVAVDLQVDGQDVPREPDRSPQ